MKKLLIIFLILTLLTTSVYAYNKTGENDYNLGTGIFNTQLTTDSSAVRSLSDGKQHPYVSDLDLDGTNEIIVLDGTTIRLYEGSSLNVVDTFTVPSVPDSNMVMHDIDGDGKTEIIIPVLNSDTIMILEYNGTSFFNQTSFTLEDKNYIEGLVGCTDDNCLLASTFIDGSTVNTTFYGFTDSAISAPQEVNSDNQALCFPVIPSMVAKDYDNDATTEYIFTQIDSNGGLDEDMYIYFITSGISPILERTIDVSADNTPILAEDVGDVISPSSAPADCNNDGGQWDTIENPPGRFITSPLVANIDGGISNGLEIIVGFNKDSDEFVMQGFNSDGSFLDEYPETQDAEGVIISNPILANAYGDSQDLEDFCVMGYDNVQDQLDLLCASELRTGLFSFESDEFFFSTVGLNNLTIEQGNYNIMTHAVQTEDSLTNGQNINEMLTAYGIFQLTDTGDILTRIYPITTTDLSCIANDAEKANAEDIICLKDTQLVYINDGLTNQPAVITDYTINPCIDTIIKVNTTMQIDVIVTDQNILGTDLVNSDVCIYKGDTNEQCSTLGNLTSGDTQPHLFEVNKTGSGYVITMEGYDTENPTVKDLITRNFIVGTNGVEFGDCSTSVTVETTEEEASDITEDGTSISGNAITSSVTELGEVVGIGAPVMFIFFLAVMVGGIFFASVQIGQPLYGFSIAVVIFTMGLWIGVKIQLISTSALIILGIIAVASLLPAFRKLFTGSNESGGF